MSSTITLRDVHEDDLPIFFEHQQDPEATQMAAFPARERDVFMAHWGRILANTSSINKTILLDGRVAGNIVCFEQDGERLVGYWIGKEYWGKGVASGALAGLLQQVQERPLFAHVVKHNLASLRVLQKCGFMIIGEEEDEYVLELNPAGQRAM